METKIALKNTTSCTALYGRSQWRHSLRRRSAAARLLRVWVRLPRGAWMFVCCDCCVLSGRGLCDELITLPEESYLLRGVVVCDIESSWMRWPWPTVGCRVKNKQTNKQTNCLYENVLRSLLRTLPRYTNSEFVKRSRQRRKSFNPYPTNVENRVSS